MALYKLNYWTLPCVINHPSHHIMMPDDQHMCPQGSILGPRLFLLFVNDMENDIESDIHLHVYADDTALVESFSRSEEDEAFSLLNRDLQKLDEWSHTWNMSFNAHKSVYTIITNKKNLC